jgi:hypothetical protein
VYIGEGSWANTEYRDNVVSFANAAVENVASAIRPCIIIVHNKCNLYEPMDVDVMTKKFLQLHENNDEVCEMRSLKFFYENFFSFYFISLRCIFSSSYFDYLV